MYVYFAHIHSYIHMYTRMHRTASGSSILHTPIEVCVYDWNSTGDDELGHWRGRLVDLLPDMETNKKPQARRRTVDATAATEGDSVDYRRATVRDGDDVGMWLALRDNETVVGLHVQAVEGMYVGMSEHGMEWLVNKRLVDESRSAPWPAPACMQ